MLFQLLLSTLLVNNVNSINPLSYLKSDPYPFSNNECVSCIEKFNYIHSHNASIVKTINQFNEFCDYYNISGCRNLTNYGSRMINQNSTLICEDLGFCDTLSLDNYLFTTSIGTQVYYFYNSLIGYDVKMLGTSQTLNYTKLWSIKLDEPYESYQLISLSTSYNTQNYPGYYRCSPCLPSVYEYIIKISTDNYVYYLNETSGVILDRIVVNNSYKVGWNPTITGETGSQYVYDTNYNGSLFSTNILVSPFYISTCNYTSNHNIYTQKCLSNSVSMTLSPININIPKEPPKCGTALEMYCPHSTTGRVNCLNCLVQNKELLSTCSVAEEELWCNN
jgi:hypothetical protein